MKTPIRTTLTLTAAVVFALSICLTAGCASDDGDGDGKCVMAKGKTMYWSQYSPTFGNGFSIVTRNGTEVSSVFSSKEHWGKKAIGGAGPAIDAKNNLAYIVTNGALDSVNLTDKTVTRLWKADQKTWEGPKISYRVKEFVYYHAPSNDLYLILDYKGLLRYDLDTKDGTFENMAKELTARGLGAFRDNKFYYPGKGGIYIHDLSDHSKEDELWVTPKDLGVTWEKAQINAVVFDEKNKRVFFNVLPAAFEDSTLYKGPIDAPKEAKSFYALKNLTTPTSITVNPDNGHLLLSSKLQSSSGSAVMLEVNGESGATVCDWKLAGNYRNYSLHITVL